MNQQKLQIAQLEAKFKEYVPLRKVATPPTGWIKAIRLALGMTLQQLANRLSITKQSARDMETREKDGSISIKSLRKAANALDMELVYGFVPKDGTLEALIDRKAREVATEIVTRTHNNMVLEDQGNTESRIQKAIDERTEQLKREIPKVLWD